jgi:hypothetical protein
MASATFRLLFPLIWIIRVRPGLRIVDGSGVGLDLQPSPRSDRAGL